VPDKSGPRGSEVERRAEMNEAPGENNGSPHLTPGSAMPAHGGMTATPYDVRFLDNMSEHHQMAVDMTKLADARAAHVELKSLAAKMQTDQAKEIVQMKQMRQRFADAPMAGMGSMPKMDMPKPDTPMDMRKLTAAKGDTFDHHFIDMMIPHHEAAIVMADDAVLNAQSEDLKRMAKAMSLAQREEIEQMKTWRSSWFAH